MAATYVKPGELGLNPEKLTEMLTELEQTVEIHSISVRFDGKVILEGAWEPFTGEAADDAFTFKNRNKYLSGICTR